jgi:hypothetical protein
MDFVNLKGNWYAFGISMNDSGDFVRQLVGLPTTGDNSKK